MTQGDKIFEIGAEIAQAAPERCSGCHTVDIHGRNAAAQVLAGEVTIEEAKENLHQDIAENCRYGLSQDGMASGYTRARCMYGVLCSFNPPEPVDRDSDFLNF